MWKKEFKFKYKIVNHFSQFIWVKVEKISDSISKQVKKIEAQAKWQFSYKKGVCVLQGSPTFMGFEAKITIQYLCWGQRLAISSPILDRLNQFRRCCGKRESGRLQQRKDVKQVSTLYNTAYDLKNICTHSSSTGAEFCGNRGLR